MRNCLRTLLIVISFTIALAIAGCSDTGGPAPEGPQLNMGALGEACFEDETCNEGLDCIDGICAVAPEPPEAECVEDSDCGEGLICEAGECIEPEAEAECATDGDCAEGQACEEGACVEKQEPKPKIKPFFPAIIKVITPQAMFYNVAKTGGLITFSALKNYQDYLDSAIKFEDQVLEAAIKKALDIESNSPVTVSECLELESLDASTCWDCEDKIKSIKGIEYCTNLTALYLGNNQISDISVLGKLTNLTYLYLWNNQISDISVLEKLTNLTWLYLGNNQISDISVLEKLTNLTELDLKNNQIKFLEPLAVNADSGGLGEGDKVVLSGNPIQNDEYSQQNLVIIHDLNKKGVEVIY